MSGVNEGGVGCREQAEGEESKVEGGRQGRGWGTLWADAAVEQSLRGGARAREVGMEG